jgi:hypothetical protein
LIFVHVDDSRVWLPADDLDWLRNGLSQAGIETRYITVVENGVPSDLVGMQWLTSTEGTYLSQESYVNKHLKVIPTQHLDTSRFSVPGSIKVGTELYDQFRSALGKLIWMEKTRQEFSCDISMLASRVKVLSMLDVQYVNDVITQIIETKKRAAFLPAISLSDGEDYEILGVCDASLAGRIDESSQGARAIGLSSTHSDVFAPVEVVSRKVRRRGSSSFDVEMLTLIECCDMTMIVRLLFEELRFGTRPSLMHRILFEVEGIAVERPSIRCVIDCDAKDCIERIYSIKDSITISKRRRVDVSDAQDLLVFRDISEFRHVAGSTNPLDVGTKKYGGKGGISRDKAPYQRLLQLLYHGSYIPDLTALERSPELHQSKVSYIQIYDVNRYPTSY